MATGLAGAAVGFFGVYGVTKAASWFSNSDANAETSTSLNHDTHDAARAPARAPGAGGSM